MPQTNVYIFSTSNFDKNSPIYGELVDKAKSGDQAAFGEIYNIFFKKIYRFIYFRVSHKEVAEDLAEEVFIKAFAKMNSVREGDAFEGWLYRIARNAVIDYYREKKINVSLDEIENTLEYEANIIEEVNLNQDQKLLLAMLKELTTEQQIVIKLKFFEDLDNSSIAEMLHKKEGAIRVIQHRAIARLQQLIKKTLANYEE